MCGRGISTPGNPRRTQRSRCFSAQARTRTSTSLLEISGSGTSRYSSTSGPPCRGITTAFIASPSAPYRSIARSRLSSLGPGLTEAFRLGKNWPSVCNHQALERKTPEEVDRVEGACRLRVGGSGSLCWSAWEHLGWLLYSPAWFSARTQEQLACRKSLPRSRKEPKRFCGGSTSPFTRSVSCWPPCCSLSTTHGAE